MKKFNLKKAQQGAKLITKCGFKVVKFHPFYYPEAKFQHKVEIKDAKGYIFHINCNSEGMAQFPSFGEAYDLFLDD